MTDNELEKMVLVASGVVILYYGYKTQFKSLKLVESDSNMQQEALAMELDWQQAQQFEKNYWGTCQNTFGEELKQMVYARKMGLQINTNTNFIQDMQNKSVLDIGGGCTSLLLKCINVRGTVLDPCNYPKWISERYKEAGIRYIKAMGETNLNESFDEVWIYNVLQHVYNPQVIINNALNSGKIIRIFEWIDMPVMPGHPNILSESRLNEWLHGNGIVENINENGAVGKCYYGIFKGKVI